MIGSFLSRQKINMSRPPDRDGKAVGLLFFGIFLVVLGIVGFLLSLFSAEETFYPGLHLSLGGAFALMGIAERLPGGRRRLTVILRVLAATAFIGVPLNFVVEAFYGDSYSRTFSLILAAALFCLLPLMWAGVLGYFKGSNRQRSVPR